MAYKSVVRCALLVLGLTLLAGTLVKAQRVKVISTQSGIRYSYSSFENSVIRRGGRLSVVNPVYDDLNMEQEGTSGAVLLLHQLEHESITKRAFEKVVSFAEQGGRVALFFTDRGARAYARKASNLLEVIVKKDQDMFEGRYTRNYISELGKGRIGCGSIGYRQGNNVYQFKPDMANVFFLPPLAQEVVIDQNKVRSYASGQNRTVYVKMKRGNGEIIIASSPQTNQGMANPFFADANYSLFSNRTLSNQLAEWLMGSSDGG
jgi:hypothetical protein